MNSKQRMTAVANGLSVDRIPFLPTILEHSAKFIGRTPSEAAIDEWLLERAQIAAYEKYGHDSVIVGTDIYNIEAEALGCAIRFYDDFSVPGIISHPLTNYEEFDFSFSTGKGRISKILNAATAINAGIGHEVNVGMAVCGPFSIAVELIGYENLIMKCMYEGDTLHRALEKILEFQKKYCSEIIRRGLGIIIFESWAALPLVTPELYRKFAAPYEKELICFIKNSNIAAVPLVIGGDTTLIIDDIIETGTTLLVSDYNTDIGFFVRKASENGLVVRGNIDPKLMQRGTKEEIIHAVKEKLDKAQAYNRFVLGTGVIAYDTPSENILAVKDYLECS